MGVIMKEYVYVYLSLIIFVFCISLSLWSVKTYYFGSCDDVKKYWHIVRVPGRCL